MQTLKVAYTGADLDYTKASMLARQAAQSHAMQDPAIMAWHQHSSHAQSPGFDGANPATWWEKYGAGNGGRMEVTVGDEFDFVLMDAGGYEKVDSLPVRNLIAHDGQEYICLAPMLGDSKSPNPRACIPIDEWAADQY